MDIYLNLSNIAGLEDFDNYEMNEQGILRNIKSGYELQGTISHGYIRFKLYQQGKSKDVKKHRILAELWLYNPLDLTCVDHIDRNKLNNDIENLRWCTSANNSRNRSKRKDNTTGESNIHKIVRRGFPYWKVKFGTHKQGNEHQKLFNRDPDSDEIPQKVIAYRDAYSKSWKGEFSPV